MDRTDRPNDVTLLTVKQAASRLSCSLANIYSLIDKGDLPIVQVGLRKGFRIDLRDIDAFIQARKFRHRGLEAVLPRLKFKHLRR